VSAVGSVARVDEVTGRRWRRVGAAALWLGLALVVAVNCYAAGAVWTLPVGLVLTTVAVATLRTAPLVAHGAGLVASLAELADYAGDQVAVWPVGLLVVTGYVAGRRSSATRPVLLLTGAAALLGLPAAVLFSRAGLSHWGIQLTGLACGAVFPWLVGRHLRLRAELAQEGWQRAQELETRQRVVADQARQRERARIAGDMHDSLGHELSLLAVRAAALEVGGGLDAGQRSAVGELREGAATATERLRQIIGVLRETDGVAPLTPARESVADLVDRAGAAGMTVRAELGSGSDPGPMVDRAVYRVVQESLTNAAKHAPGAAVAVRVVVTGSATEVEVVNEPPAGPTPAAVSGGHGLIGLDERVRLAGGALSAAPRNGGFAVTATLPHHAPPPQTVPAAPAHRELAQRRVRRSLLQAILLPVGLFGLVVALSGAAFGWNWLTSDLRSPSYAAMRVGEPRAELAGLLPTNQRLARPTPVPAAPPGATCEFYGADGSRLFTDFQAYRLCFAHGVLVARDFLPDRAARP
jgi:signal transduction histidine kinase